MLWSVPALAQLGATSPRSAAETAASVGGSLEREDELDRWVPAFAIYSGTLVEGGDGASESGPALENPFSHPVPQDCDRDPATPGVNVLRCPADGGDTLVTPSVGGAVEIMTPGWTFVPGSPRAFVHVGAAAAFSSQYDLAKEGVPEDFNLIETTPPRPPTEASVGGQGSLTQVEVKPLVVSAGAGVAFTIDALDRRFRVKPSVEYKLETVKVSGLLHRSVSFFPPGVTPTIPPREVELVASDDKTFHGIGPGLEVEMDAARAGSFVMTVFISGRAYRFLGDRKIEIEASNQAPVESEMARWSYKKHRWGYEGGLGVRFRWLPQ